MAEKKVKKTKVKKEEKQVNEDTTRIRIDDSRINDADSLDISFVEGKRKKANKEKILKEKKDHSILYSILKFIVLLLILSVLLVFGYMYVRDNHLLDNLFKVESKEVKKEEKESVNTMDYNYLFIGDYHTNGLEFDEFYKPYVKISNDDYTTSDILDDLRDYVYVYNPTHVFIQLGINDFKTETSISEVVDNLRNIVKGIQNNRSKAIIYVESLYPVNTNEDDSINNDFIIDINDEIKTMCESLDVNYIDMYSELSSNNLLKEDYSDDGINLNSDGYKKVFKVINRYIDERD